MSEALAVRMVGITKRFGSVVANQDASLEVATGEIHAVVGENGAGKSTLMRILGGLHAPDAGSVEVKGRTVTSWSTPEAIAAGVGMVHQHFMLVPTLTVAENVVLGMEPGGMTIDMDRAIDDVSALSARSGLVVDPKARVRDLSVGEAQRVEILKALYRGATTLILDEPTAVLSPLEVADLWRVLRTLVQSGGTVILITHKLDEVMAVSDTITVMRAGSTIARLRTAETTPREVARAMVGRDVALALDAVGLTETGEHPATHSVGISRGVVSRASTSLTIAGLSVGNDRGRVAVDDLSFTVAPGEIFGIAGVEGNGQTELLEAIAGLRAPTGGTIAIGPFQFEARNTRLDVRARSNAGLSHIPEDRHRRGLVLDYSVSDNLILGGQRYFAPHGRLDRADILRNAREKIATFDIRPPDPALPARALSGGNQQKIVIAREMGRAFLVLLAAQPTRGVDVGAIEFIHAQLRAARDAGKAILLVSADLPEVLALSTRIAVMYRGRFATVLPTEACSAELLGPYMTGAQ